MITPSVTPQNVTAIRLNSLRIPFQAHHKTMIHKDLGIYPLCIYIHLQEDPKLLQIQGL